MPASKQHPYPRSMTVGVQADVRIKPADWTVPAIGGNVSTGVAFDFDGDGVAWYIGVSPMTGLIPRKGAVSGSCGIELGFWWDKVEDLEGQSFGVVLGYATPEGGAEVGVFFDVSMNFQGFQIVPQVGKEIELSVGTGYTLTVA